MSESTLEALGGGAARPAEFGHDALVVCDSLVRIFQSGSVEVQALQGLDLMVDDGEMIAVVGASGSGKSTLLGVLSGMDAPTAGRVRALLVTGAVWGLWHAPIILLGYDFARPDALGLALMVGGCMAYGVLIGWLRIRSASIWPSVFAHGAFNAAGGFAVLVLAAGSPADPAAAGPLGWVAWILMAAIALVLLLTRQFPARGAWAVPGVKRPQAEPTPS